MGLVLKFLNEWCSINVNAVKVIHLFANLGLALARFAIRLVAQVLLVHSDIRFPIAHRFVLLVSRLVVLRDLSKGEFSQRLLGVNCVQLVHFRGEIFLRFCVDVVLR